MSVPASLYFVQNLLGIVGFSRVPVPIVAVLGQTKVATSAIFTVFMLDRKFSAAQVRALIQVVLGASLVVLHTSEAMEQAKGGDQPVHQVNFWMHWVPLELIKRNNTISNKRRLQYTLFYFNEAETYHGARIFSLSYTSISTTIVSSWHWSACQRVFYFRIELCIHGESSQRLGYAVTSHTLQNNSLP